jgi:hypothetical protein
VRRIDGAWVLRIAIVAIAAFSLIRTISFGGEQARRPTPAEPETTSSPEATPAHSNEITVPDLVERELDRARETLVGIGLFADVGVLARRSGLWSMVIGQSPEPGATLPRGELVQLIVTKSERPPLELPTLKEGECPTSRVRSIRGLRIASVSEHMALGSASDDGVLDVGSALPSDDGFRASLLWATRGGYKGPVLIRGDRIDGDAELRFEQDGDITPNGPTLYGTPTEFHFARGGFPQPAWSTVVEIPGPGCYAFQIDGRDFSEHIVVLAR